MLLQNGCLVIGDDDYVTVKHCDVKQQTQWWSFSKYEKRLW